jgi:hypothetical protein
MDEELGTRSEGCAGAGVTVLIIIAALAMMLCLCACKTQTKVVQVPTYLHDTTTVYRYNVQRDTLHSYTRDSVFIYTKGDTVYHNAVRYIDNSRVVYRCDTVHSNKVVERPVVVTKTQVKEVEKQLTKWQRTKMKLGGWLLAVLAAVLLGGAVYGIIKLRRLYR